MDIGTIVGIVIGVVAITFGILVGGGSPASLIDIPSIALVFGGTTGAIIMSFPLPRVLKVHKVILQTVFTKSADPTQIIKDIVRYAEVARREGILALENHIGEMSDEFIIRGVKMAVDGTDPELINQIMEIELEAVIDRHAQGKQILDTTGRYAPAFGMIGTLLGLIFMLSNMDDPSKIGPGMAVALITTLYGAMIANMVTGPIGDKLQARDAEEIMIKTIVIAGVMAIQSGDNPRVVENKLMTYLPPARRLELEKQQAA